MWFIADIFERYTTSVARGFLRLAVNEAEANRRALEKMRARRLKERAASVITQETEVATSAEVAQPLESTALSTEALAPVGSPVEAAIAEAPVEAAVVETTSEVVAEADSAVVETAPIERPELDPNRTFPVGVRGTVVIGWVDALLDAARADVADLVEALRKDKKVRVPELRIIAAEVMGEEPQNRKKAEHLSEIRQHLAPEFARAAAAGEAAAHA